MDRQEKEISLFPWPAGISSSLWLINMRERVALTGGRMEIETKLDQGTKIHASFPIIWHDQDNGRQGTLL